MRDKLTLPFFKSVRGFLSIVFLFYWAASCFAQELTKEGAAAFVEPPYQLGKSIGKGGWELINLDGRVAGYGFETLPLAPLPGFSGAPINLFVSVTLEGRFIDADIISHNEPIFVSGLDEALFHNFVTQYNGKSITDTLVVGVPYGKKTAGSSLIYLDGVTKGTASVRIAHETILAAAFKIARDKLGIAGSTQKVHPNLNYSEELNWDDLVKQGIVKRLLVKNVEVQNAFEGTLWAQDDAISISNPNDTYLDLWVVNIASTSIARAILTPQSVTELKSFLAISKNAEPILLIDAGRHGLVGDDFVRNTSPDLIFLKQGGLPIALRDSDLEFQMLANVPGTTAMIFRTDRRLGFDPTSEWELTIRSVRAHGSFRPVYGTKDFSVTHKIDARFYTIEEEQKPLAPWIQAIFQRGFDIGAVIIGIVFLMWVLWVKMSWFAGLKYYTPIRLTILSLVIIFVGWLGQGQLSIATVLGVFRGLVENKSLAFLLYDPFSMVIWLMVIVSFFIWGRGLFCGWLCPFGAMQELAHHLGRLLKLPSYDVPDFLDRIFLKLKYVVLIIMLSAAIFSPALNDKLIELEPFKTAVTTFFVREWYFVAYAVGILLSSMIFFKGFCRYLCPLGAVMAIGGLFRLNNWIERRAQCGSPCQLCKVKCNYNAIKKSGAINYRECFQCLDCVTIHDNHQKCVPLILAAKRRG